MPGDRVIDVEQHLDMVRYETYRIGRMWTPLRIVDYEDLLHEGVLGLLRAANKWVSGKTDAPFRSYARYFVRGALYRAYSLELKRSVDMYEDRRRSAPMWPIDNIQMIPILDPDALQESLDDFRALERYLVGSELDTAEIEINSDLDLLGPQEQTVVRLFYVDELDLTAIGKEIGIKNISTVSQIKDRALDKIRKVYGVQKRRNLKHGTLNAYRYCRCDLCCAAQREANLRASRRRVPVARIRVKDTKTKRHFGTRPFTGARFLENGMVKVEWYFDGGRKSKTFGKDSASARKQADWTLQKMIARKVAEKQHYEAVAKATPQKYF